MCFDNIRAVLQKLYTCIVTLNLATIVYREQEDKLIKTRRKKTYNQVEKMFLDGNLHKENSYSTFIFIALMYTLNK